MPNPESVEYLMKAVPEWSRPMAPVAYGDVEPFYPMEICHECGEMVRANWYVRHIKSGCEIGGHGRPDAMLVKDGKRIPLEVTVVYGRGRAEVRADSTTIENAI